MTNPAIGITINIEIRYITIDHAKKPSASVKLSPYTKYANRIQIPTQISSER